MMKKNNLNNMETVNIEQLEEWGFEYVEDGQETYYQKVLGNDYFNDPYLYADKVRMGEYVVYEGRTHVALSTEEVKILIK